MSQTNQHDPYAALRIAVYRLFTIGWLCGLIGNRIQSVAVAWEVYLRTNDALALGYVGLAQALPTMLFALPAGYLADRFNRPRLLMLGESVRVLGALGMLYVSWTHAPIFWVYLLLFLDATASILGRPARAALVPQLVPTSVFPNAVTWNTSLIQLSSVFGPAIGGLALIYGAPAAYALNALGALTFILVLAKLNLHDAGKRTGGISLQTLLAGIHYVWHERILFVLMALDLFAVLLGGAVYLLPVYAKDILKVDATGFGLLRAAPAVGAFCMALLLIYLPPMRRAGWSLLLNVAGFGLATIVFGFTRNFWLAFAMLFLTGAFDNVSMVIRGTVQQLRTPDAMRGRVSAVSSVFIGASNELGGYESGLVANWYGPVFSVVSGGVGTLLVVALTAWLSPHLRALGRLDEAGKKDEG